ncbi:MAG: ribosome biogenesis GTP-binding protein YihA/YsxC [Bacteroidales bacterium]
MDAPVIRNVKFLGSFPNLASCPVTDLPEFAFIGRSNVGKSSLINLLTGVKELARTSSTPGKTLLINSFQCDDKFVLIDLPGYGFARISKTERERIRKLVNGYLLKSERLQGVFLLIDIRIPRQESDKAFMEWLAENGIPFVLVFTKADKLSRIQVKKSLEKYSADLQQEWERIPEFFITSSKTKSGRDELLSFILQLARDWK